MRFQSADYVNDRGKRALPRLSEEKIGDLSAAREETNYPKYTATLLLYIAAHST